MSGENQRSFWQSSIAVTVVTALVGLLGTGVGVSLQGYHDTQLERQKFESTLIFRALEPKDAQARANYLLFLIDAGLVDSLDVEKIRTLAEKPARIPSANPDLKLKSSADILSLSSSVPGEIRIADNSLWKSWDENGVVFAASRMYEFGRVIAFGHDDILRVKGNRSDLAQTVTWLAEPTGSSQVGFATGHCEWIPVKYADEGQKLYDAVSSWKYAVKEIPGEITSASLADVGVLVIGNAWGSFTNAEIEAVEKFVAEGGGLLTAGLGWSWKAYASQDGYRCEGKTQGQNTADISTYPMNRLTAMFGAGWTDRAIE